MRKIIVTLKFSGLSAYSRKKGVKETRVYVSRFFRYFSDKSIVDDVGSRQDIAICNAAPETYVYWYTEDIEEVEGGAISTYCRFIGECKDSIIYDNLLYNNNCSEYIQLPITGTTLPVVIYHDPDDIVDITVTPETLAVLQELQKYDNKLCTDYFATAEYSYSDMADMEMSRSELRAVMSI